jgi:hypothetical protein
LHEAKYPLLGLVALAGVSGLNFWLSLPIVPVAFTYLIVLVLFALVSNFHFLDYCFFHRRLLPDLFFAWPIYGFVFQLTLPGKGTHDFSSGGSNRLESLFPARRGAKSLTKP